MTFPAPGLGWFKWRRKQPARQLALEALEDRNMPSASPAPAAIDLSGLAVNTSKYSPGDILVQFKPGAVTGNSAPTLPGTTAGPALGLVPGLYKVTLNAGMTVSRALAEYATDPLVQIAGPDYALTSSAVSNDPNFNQQWALQNTGQGGGTAGDDIGATRAWTVTTGSARTVVALMDTGVDYNQADLAGNIWINQAEIPKSRLAPSLGGTNPNGIQDYNHDGYVSWRDLNDPRNIGPGKISDVNGDGIIDAGDILAPMVVNAQGQDTGLGGWSYAGNTQDGDTAHPNDFIGWNFVDNNNNPFDQNGHGTHVAGIIGATGNNGVGVTGIDWQVGLMPVQFIGANGTGAISDFIQGLNYAVQHGAKISNNSWSGASSDPVLSAAIGNARDAGMIFVAAAGNEGANTDVTPAYPSSFNLSNIVSVAAVDNNNQLASFSNYGAHTVDLAAPGVNILSTLPNNTFGTMSGTSMAAPMVTGVLALVWSEHPGWSYQQVINQVLSTVDPVPGLQGKVLTGGVLDAARAVGYNPTTPTPPTPPINANLQVVSTSSSGPTANTLNSITLTFNAAVNPAVLNNGNVTLTGPNGQNIPLQSFQAVPGSNGTQVSVFLPTQAGSGTYTIKVNSGITSASGATLAADYQNTFSLGSLYQFSTTTPIGIPDVSQTSTSLTVSRNVVIGKVTVSVNIVNSVDSKMVLILQSPDGTNVVLANLAGGNGTSFIGTVFDDAAGAPIQSGDGPFTGSYQPQNPLSALIGKNAQGTWKLSVVDHATNYFVVLTGWSLTISAPNGTTTIASVATGSDTGGKAAASASQVATAPGAAHSAGVASGLASEARFSAGVLASLDSPATPGGATAPSEAFGAVRATQAADELFASLDGVDRLAELRVMMPHANRANQFTDETLTDDIFSDDGSDAADVVEVATIALLDP
jgi:subtilisin family serine protease/subtilisin-like proprotein convertase family protein